MSSERVIRTHTFAFMFLITLLPAIACAPLGGGLGDSTPAKPLLVEYGENPVAWNEKWKGKDVLVRGKVREIRESPAHNGIVVLLDAGDLEYIEAVVPESNRRDVLDMKVGETVDLSCVVKGGDSEFFTVIYLERCGTKEEQGEERDPNKSIVR